MFPDIFRPVDLSLANHHLNRRYELVFLSDLLASHFDAYPSSLSSIRRLVVEVRDDDDFTSWEHVTRLALQLEMITFHVYDRFWRIAHTVEWEDGNDLRDDCAAVGPPGSTGHYSDDVWDRALRNGISFPSLTCLTIATTARIYETFRGIAERCPNLVELNLSCHWDSSNAEFHFCYDYARLPTFPMLERFRAIGPVIHTLDIILSVLPSCPNLRYLTVYLSDWSLDTPNLGSLREVAESIRTKVDLQGLALYGRSTYELLRQIIRLGAPESSHAEPRGYEKIDTLDLEQTCIDGEGKRVYPLLSEPDNRPDFPSLHTLILTLDKHDPIGTRAESYYDVSQLQGLFASYPSLQVVQWVSSYNTLGVDPPSPNPTLLCRVTREESERTHPVAASIQDMDGGQLMI